MFKLKSKPEVTYPTLMDMKKALGLSEEDTVFGYCKRTDDVIYSRLSEGYPYRGTVLSYWRTFYDFKKMIGV